MLSVASQRPAAFSRLRSTFAKHQLLIVAVCALAAAMTGIGTPGIGFDEAASWWAANLPWSGLSLLLVIRI